MAVVESQKASDKCLNVVIYARLVLVMIVTLYPCWYVIVASFSNPVELYNGSTLLLWPRGFSTEAYGIILEHTMLWRSYGNTLIYVSASTILGLALSIAGAFVFTRSYLPGNRFMLSLVTVTMFFGGGLIPTYLVVARMKLVDTRWAMILPGLLSSYNLIVMMSYFRGIPASLEESARLDGANDFVILTRIIVPLSKAVIAVIALYILVGSWNSYMPAIIYLRNRDLYPLQVILREILISGSSNLDTVTSGFDDFAAYSEAVKYASIIVSTLPIIIIYPFLQKFFVKGVMLGAIKG